MQNGLQCDDFNQTWYELTTDNIFAKIHKKVEEENSTKRATKFIISIFFENKVLKFINLNSILHDNQTCNCLPDLLNFDEVPFVGSTIANSN